MGKELVISSNRHETKVAVLEDDQLVEIFFQRANEYSLAGSIHKGRVTRVLPGMQSAFVDIGLDTGRVPLRFRFLRGARGVRQDGGCTRGRGRRRGAATGPAPRVARPPPPPPHRQSRWRQRRPGTRGGPGPQERRSRRRRSRGRGFPDSKYVLRLSPSLPPPPNPRAEPRDRSRRRTDFAVLPGETLANTARTRAARAVERGSRTEVPRRWIASPKNRPPRRSCPRSRPESSASPWRRKPEEPLAGLTPELARGASVPRAEMERKPKSKSRSRSGTEPEELARDWMPDSEAGLAEEASPERRRKRPSDRAPAGIARAGRAGAGGPLPAPRFPPAAPQDARRRGGVEPRGDQQHERPEAARPPGNRSRHRGRRRDGRATSITRPAARRAGDPGPDRQGAAGPEGRAHHLAHRAARPLRRLHADRRAHRRVAQDRLRRGAACG